MTYLSTTLTEIFMRHKKQTIVVLLVSGIIAFAQCTKNHKALKGKEENKPDDRALIAEGKNIFRFDSFGDEDFWSGLLHLDKAIVGFVRGYGAGVSPKTALAV